MALVSLKNYWRRSTSKNIVESSSTRTPLSKSNLRSYPKSYSKSKHTFQKTIFFLWGPQTFVFKDTKIQYTLVENLSEHYFSCPQRFSKSHPLFKRDFNLVETNKKKRKNLSRTSITSLFYYPHYLKRYFCYVIQPDFIKTDTTGDSTRAKRLY